MDEGVERGLRDELLRAIAGDAAAYHRFLAQTSGLVRAYLRRRLSSLPDEVEDLVQETLLAVHNQRHTYDPSQPLGPWMYALARYKLIDLLRRRSRRELLHDPFDEESDARFSCDDAAGEARRDILRLLDELPDRHRLPILRVKIEGLSVAEAAHETGMSASAIKVGIHRGLKALAARIGGGS